MTIDGACQGHHISDLLTTFIQQDVTDQQAEDLLITLTSRAMHARLRRDREVEKKVSWHHPEQTNAKLLVQLEEASSVPLTEHSIVEMINLLAALRARMMVYGEKA